ncbi:MAG: hypothetical protein WC905_00485 [Patescibacteria group bacterium]|jgi:hypothetical protein
MDTIKLKFKYPKPNNSFFSEQIHKKDLALEHISGSRYVWTNNNWRNEQTDKGLYIPKYWIEQDFKNPDETYFLIELSAPKFLNGENISALKETDLTPLVKKISKFCQGLGVFIFEKQILGAVPTVLAVGININITHLCFCESVVEALCKFDYKPYAIQRIIFLLDLKNAGREIIFSIPNTETFKIYSKNREIMNNAKTVKEKQIAELLKADKYKKDQVYINEILRVELTLKTCRKIKERLKPYLGETAPTLENIFKPQIWEALIKEEINQIYNHPLKNFIFLSLEQEPFIEAFLDKNYSHIETKDTIMGIIAGLQKKGIAQTRKDYFKKYKSRQTWYNYLGRLEKLEGYLDLKAIANLSSFQIHSFILKQFGIENSQQIELEFNSSVSKKIDTKRRNTTAFL